MCAALGCGVTCAAHVSCGGAAAWAVGTGLCGWLADMWTHQLVSTLCVCVHDYRVHVCSVECACSARVTACISCMVCSVWMMVPRQAGRHALCGVLVACAVLQRLPAPLCEGVSLAGKIVYQGCVVCVGAGHREVGWVRPPVTVCACSVGALCACAPETCEAVLALWCAQCVRACTRAVHWTGYLQWRVHVVRPAYL